MPLDLATKERSLRAAGYDPSKYDVDDDGNVSEKIATSPSITETPAPLQTKLQPSSSVGGALGRSALASAIPTGAGLGSAALASWVLGPEVGLPVSLIAGFGSAIAGGAAASALQNKMLSEDTKQQLSTDIQEHPLATTVGGFLPVAVAANPIAGARALFPNAATESSGLIGSAVKLLGPGGVKSIGTADQQLLTHAAANVGVGSGMDIYNQMQSGEPFDYGKLATTAALSSIFNSPYGSKAGHTPTIEAAPRVETEQPLQTKATEYPTPNPISGELPTGGTSGMIAAPELRPSLRSGPMRTAAERSDTMAKYKGDVNPTDEELSRGLGEGQPEPKINKAEETLQELKNAEDLANVEKQRLAKAEALRQAKLMEVERGKVEAETKTLQEQIEAGQITPQPIKGVNPQRDFTRGMQQGNKEVAQESPADLAARQAEGLGDKYSSESALPQDLDNDPRLLKYFPPEYHQKVIVLANKRGITLKAALKVIDPLTGKEKLGSYNQPTRTATISTTKAAADTPPHEVAHGFIADLLSSSDPADVALAKRGLEIHGGDVDAAEEALVSQLGADYFHRTLNNPIANWGRDLVARYKKVLGVVSDKDVMQHLSSRLERDAPYGSRSELVAPADRAGRLQYLRGLSNPTEEQKKQMEEDQAISDKNNSREAWKGMGFQHESKLGEDFLDKKRRENQSPALLRSQEARRIRTTLAAKGITGGAGEDHVFINGAKRPISDIIDSTRPMIDRWMDLSRQHIEEHQKGLPEGSLYKDTKYQDSSAIELPSFSGSLRDKEIGRIEEWLKENASKKPDEKEWNDKYNRYLTLKNQDELEGFSNQRKGILYEEPGNPKYQDKSSITPADIKLGSSSKGASKEKEADIGYKTFRLTQTVNETILKRGGDSAPEFVRGINNFYPERDKLYATYMNPVHDALGKLSKDQQENVHNTLVAENYSKADHSNSLTTPEEKAAYNTIRQSLLKKQNDQIAAGQPVTAYDNKNRPFPREAKIDPYYFPNQISPHVIETLTEHPNSPEAQQLRADFLEHQLASGNNKEKANVILENIEKAYDKGAGDQSHFRAVDVEQGVGLPQSWMRPGIERNLSRYFRRVANARSFYDNIESNPDIAKSLGYDKDAWGKPIESDAAPLNIKEARDVIDSIKGEDYSKEERKVKSLNRIATSLFLGPLTNIHIAASSIANALSYYHPKDIPGAITHAITHWGEGVQHALDNGYLTKNPKIFRDFLDAHSSSSEKMNSLAEGISRLSGRGVTNYVTKGLLQNMGEYLTKTTALRASTGDKVAQRLMKHIDPDYIDGKRYQQSEINDLASNFGNILHGAHDARTLPSWMLKETAIQPFVSLASWNVAQTNNFMRHVWQPAREGNYTPLIMSTLGAVLGGYVIKEAREGLADKKSPIPSLEEIVKGDNASTKIPLAAYNAMAMASYSGYAGILSTLGKVGFDVAYKNHPQGAAFPLDEVLTSSGGTILHAASAIINSRPEEYFQIAAKASADLLKENVQLARVGMAWANEGGLLGKSMQERQDLQKKEGDLRRFKMVEGMPYQEQSENTDNPYLNMGRKTFQRTHDLGVAIKELPEAIAGAIKDSDGNIETLRSKLNALKDSQFPTLPSPDRMPMTFFKYLQYLRETQGEKAASDRLQEYIKNNAINRAKSEMVPSL